MSSNASERSPQAVPQPGSAPDKATREMALSIAARLDEKQASNIQILDVSGPLVIADYFIVATVQSTRQAQALAKEVDMAHKSARGRRKRNGGADTADSAWVLLDFSDIVVHLFLPEAREYYGLESLWVDVPRLPFTAAAPKAPTADDAVEVRQPTLDGFGAFQPGPKPAEEVPAADPEESPEGDAPRDGDE